VVAGDQELAAVELRGQRERVGDRPERDVAEVQDDIGGSDSLVPATDQLSIHLRNRPEWAGGEFTDPRVAEVRVGGDVVDLVEVKRRILVEHRKAPLCLARMPSRATYQSGRQRACSIGRRVVG